MERKSDVLGDLRIGDMNLLNLLQEGQGTANRLFLHAGLLKRRLQAGADVVDLVQLVQAIQFATEDLQALFRAAVQAVTPTANRVSTGAEASPGSKPMPTEVIDLRTLLSRCAESVRQRAHNRGVSLRCTLAPDLPSLVTDPEKVAQVFSLLLDHAVAACGKGPLEVQVRWTAGALVVDVYDAGRGISQETYVSLLTLIGSLRGTLVVTREFGKRSSVEFSFPPAPVPKEAAPHITLLEQGERKRR